MEITLLRYWAREVRSPQEVEFFAKFLKRGTVRGWKTHIVFARPPEDLAWLSPLKEEGMQVEFIPRPKGNFDWNVIRKAFKLCHRIRASIIHCDNTHTSPIIGAYFAGVPVRLWFKRAMEPAYAEARIPTWRDRWAPSLHLSCRLATKTVAVSEAVRDELIDLHVPPSKVCVFRNSANLRALHFGDRDKVRASFGYEKSHVVIATVGRAAPVKGWDVLLEAFFKVSKECPDARLLFIGGIERSDEHEGYADLQRCIEKQGLQDYVRFVGHQEDIGGLLSATDIFAFPSRSEGYGVALHEAFILGLACVATKVGIAPAMISHGTNGFLVERNNPEQMAEALSTLVSDSNLRQTFARAARESNFGCSMDEYGDRLYDLYQSMLDGGRLVASENIESQRRVA